MSAKEIIIKPIKKADADALVKKYHYSKKVCQNSQINFGVFWRGRSIGALQFGPSMDKRRMAANLGIGINEFLELNRMAISDFGPKYCESRAIAVSIRLIQKHYPHIRLILSFADACQCGDGTIYRASGFKLHSYKINESLLVSPDGSHVIARKSLDDYRTSDGKYLSSKYKNKYGYRPLVGYQMKYIYLIDKSLDSNYTWVPFDKIPADAKMYKGIRAQSIDSDASGDQPGEGGVNPTCALQLSRAHYGAA